MVKVVKDPNVPRDDLYKSSTIHTGQGEPPNSVSKPTPRGKQIAGKPITKGKLLRPGGPGGAPSKLTSRPAQARPAPQTTSHPAASQGRGFPQATAAPNGVNHTHSASVSSTRAPPPPPPPSAPPAAKEPIYRAIYDFNGQTSGEMSVTKDDVVIITQKEDNGKCIHVLHMRIQCLRPHQGGGWLVARITQLLVGSPPHI